MSNTIYSKSNQSDYALYKITSDASDVLFNIAERFTNSFDPSEIARTRLPRELGFDYCRFDAGRSFESYLEHLFSNSWHRTEVCIRATTLGTLAYALHLIVGVFTLYEFEALNFETSLVEEFNDKIKYLDLGALYSEWAFSDDYIGIWDVGMPLADRLFHWCTQWGLHRMLDTDEVFPWSMLSLKRSLRLECCTLKCDVVHQAVDFLCNNLYVSKNTRTNWIRASAFTSLLNLLRDLANYLREYCTSADIISFGNSDPIVYCDIIAGIIERYIDTLPNVD